MFLIASSSYYKGGVRLIAPCCSAFLGSIRSYKKNIQKRKGKDRVEWTPWQEPLIHSPDRIRELIAAQTDPLLAKEIFDLASRYPTFRQSNFRRYSPTYHDLITKLGRARHFHFMDALLSSLRCQHCTISESLFSDIIKIYDEAERPDKALKTFYTILNFNMKPRVQHLNQILEILVSDHNFIQPAFEFLEEARRNSVCPNIESYNILMRAFCLNNNLSNAFSLFNYMFEKDVLPDVESHRILMQGLCRRSHVSTALVSGLCNQWKYVLAKVYIEEMLSKGVSPHFSLIHVLVRGFCSAGLIDEASTVLENLLQHEETPLADTWLEVISRVCVVDDTEEIDKVMTIKIMPYTKQVEDGAGL